MSFSYYYIGKGTEGTAEQIATLSQEVADLTVQVNNTATNSVSRLNPIFLGNLEANQFRLGNIGNAVSNNDAINKITFDNNNTSINSNINNINSNITDIKSNLLPLKANLSGANFTGDVSISANLIVNGTTTSINSTNSNISDNLVRLASNNTIADTVDIGFFAPHYKSSHIHYSGFYKKHGTNKFKLFETREDPSTSLTINEAGAGYTLRELECTQITLADDGTASDQAVRKSQLDTKLNLSGGTLTGSLNMSNQQISNIASLHTSSNIKIIIGSGFLETEVVNLTTGNLKLSTGTALRTNYLNPCEETTTDKIAIGRAELTGIGFKDTATVIANLAINPNGVVFNNVNNFESVLDITVNNTDRVLRQIPVGGNMLNNQQLIVKNNSGSSVYIQNRATGSAGDIECLPNTILHNKGQLILNYNNSTNRWQVNGQDLKLIEDRAFNIRWSGDNILSTKINSNYTYRFALNFTNTAGSPSVNGVTFTNVTSMNYTSAAIDFSQNGTSLFFSGSSPASELTATESAKLAKFIYSFTSLDFSLKGLTPTKYYELLIFIMVYDDTNRYWSLLDNMNSEWKLNLKNINQLEFVESGAVGSNEAGVITSYIFRARGTSYDFRLDNNVSAAHIYAMACIEHDYSFNPN